MALNYHKQKLMRNAFAAIKKVPSHEKAGKILKHLVLQKLRLGFREIKRDAIESE